MLNVTGSLYDSMRVSCNVLKALFEGLVCSSIAGEKCLMGPAGSKLNGGATCEGAHVLLNVGGAMFEFTRDL